jgi:hypothetical protein
VDARSASVRLTKGAAFFASRLVAMPRAPVRDGCTACAGAAAIPRTDLARVDALVAGRRQLAP